MTKMFISYSHQDKVWLKRLQVYLKPVEREVLIERWDDTQIRPGTPSWQEAIKQALNEAKVAVLLVSEHFLASDFIANQELPSLLAKAAQGGTHILPVIVSPCGYKRTPELKEYQAVNDPQRTLAEMKPAGRKRTLQVLADLIENELRP